MLPDRVSNPGRLTFESGALPIALRGPTNCTEDKLYCRPLYCRPMMLPHRRRKVLNIGGGGGEGKVQNIVGRGPRGGGGKLFAGYTDRSPRPQSVLSDYISHIEN